MRKILTFEGPIIQFFHKTGELIIATMLFLLFCIPIVTVGASITSFYYTVIKSVRRERGYVTAEFMRSLRRTLGRGSILTVGMLAWFGLLWLGKRQTNGHMALAYNTLIIVSICVSVYIFPVLSRFEMNLTGIVKLSFVMSIRYFYYTIPILIGTVLLVWFQYFYLPIPCIFILPGVWCYMVTFMMERALLGYMPAKEEVKEDSQSIETDAWYYD
ncbi:MAG: YesL family protein [Lachnospiraceae bacterium]|jgi:Predicted integral membrane protein